jgi:hypothetical protein
MSLFERFGICYVIVNKLSRNKIHLKIIVNLNVNL